MKFKYLRYIIISILLAVLIGVIPLIMANCTQTMDINKYYIYWGMVGVWAFFWLFLLISIFRYIIHQNIIDQVNSWWGILLSLIGWIIFSLILLYKDFSQIQVVLSSSLIGVAILLISLFLFQPIDLDKVTDKDKIHNRRMNLIVIFIATVGFVFGMLTVNLMTGIIILITILLIADVKWPIVFVRYQRKILQNYLVKNGVVVNNWEILNDLLKIKNILLEKSGVLTELESNIYSVKSVDDRYSDHDVIGIAAGLLQNFSSPLSRGFLKYVYDQEIEISEVTEPEKINLIGVSGVINQERFAVISSREALKNYAVSAEVLANYQAIGNSVSYIVDGIQVIGIINYGTPLKYSILEIDRMLVKRGIKTQIISADAVGSVNTLNELFESASYVKAGLSPKDKYAMQINALQSKGSMFITNQQIPKGLPDIIIMEIGDSLPIVDAQLNDLEQLEMIFKSADQLKCINKRNLCLLNIGVIFLFLIGLFLGLMLSGSWIVLAPIIAVVIRLIIIVILMYKMRKA